MMEVTVTKRRRSWEWQVLAHDGTLLMHGRERSRPAARYRGYRSLFMLLAVGRRPDPARLSRRSRPAIDRVSAPAPRRLGRPDRKRTDRDHVTDRCRA